MSEKNKKPAHTPAPAATKPAETPVPAAKAEPAAPVVEYVTSTDLAATIGTKGTILRRWLRTLPQFQDSGYTRYKWEKSDPFLKDAEESFAKFQKRDEERKAAKAAENAEKKAKKEAGETVTEKPAKGKKSKPDPEPDAEDEPELEDDDQGEELE